MKWKFECKFVTYTVPVKSSKIVPATEQASISAAIGFCYVSLVIWTTIARNIDGNVTELKALKISVVYVPISDNVLLTRLNFARIIFC